MTLHAVSPDDDLRQVLRMMAEQDVNQYRSSMTCASSTHIPAPTSCA